ncbi:MAG: hypothetical protein Q4A55_04255 [Aerococcus sp.]|nr:hypothetical protein [Aerococcus sp.]
MEVKSFVELEKALLNQSDTIEITRSFMATHALILPPHTTLKGIPQENGVIPTLMFEHTDGVGLTSDNTITDLNIQTPEAQKAIFTTGLDEDLGHFEFRHLKVSGQLLFIMRKGSLKADVVMDDIHVLTSDTRGYLEQPQKYGVNVLQGALTIYNFNPNPDSLITMHAEHISIGTMDHPVTGSGVFVGGFGDNGGRVELDYLQTDNVYSTGRIPFGVADIITAAIFIVNSVHAKTVQHDGETITFGVNDMVLDAWGVVDEWLINGPVISYGPSGVGFVNFGTVKNFIATAPIETYGLGARGYNQYDGTLEHGEFADIRTYGDGSVGVQVSKKIGNITIHGNIETQGGLGNSLVKGVNVELPAYALSIKDGGYVDKIEVSGDIKTNGDEVTTFVMEDGGEINQMTVQGAITAAGSDSKAYDLDDGAKLGDHDFEIEE